MIDYVGDAFELRKFSWVRFTNNVRTSEYLSSLEEMQDDPLSLLLSQVNLEYSTD